MSETIRHYWGNGIDSETGEKYDAKLTKEDVIEMQCIDADCNDCIHFLRGKMEVVPGLKYFLGHCKKFDHPTRAYPGQYSGHPCFEHRRLAAMPPKPSEENAPA